MNIKTKTLSFIAAVSIAASTTLTAATPTFAHDGAHSEPNAGTPATAGDLRVMLSSYLAEHVQLAASATGGALGGRDAQFKAAAGALDNNSVDISKAIGLVYGAGAEQAFLPLWRKHIGFFVDYTTGVATKDQIKADKAIADLVQYTEDFGAFLNSANPNLPKAAVAALVKDHALGLKNVVDAQAAGDVKKQFSELRTAFAHMDMIGTALAGGIAAQFPSRFPGKADDAMSNLRAALNLTLSEHAYLAARATGAALGGRTAEFEAAAGALDNNSVDLSKAIGSVYGAGAEQAFLPLWRKHIGFVVDYTTGLAAKDSAKSGKAVTDLLQYTEDFGAFLNSANPNLPKDAVAGLVKTHIITLKDVIDAQAAGDQNKVYTQVRLAYHHMGMIADPLAMAIVKQFPAKFGMMVMLPVTGAPAQSTSPITLFVLVVGFISLSTVAIRKIAANNVNKQ